MNLVEVDARLDVLLLMAKNSATVQSVMSCPLQGELSASVGVV